MEVAKYIYIIVFGSTNHSMLAYNILRNAQYSIEIISTPCTLSAGCSRALRYEGVASDVVKIKNLISENKIFIRGIYKKVIESKVRFHYERIG